jgi:hypothetical protein
MRRDQSVRKAHNPMMGEDIKSLIDFGQAAPFNRMSKEGLVPAIVTGRPEFAPDRT